MGRVVTLPQETAEVRVLDSLRIVGHAVAGRGVLRESLLWGLAGYGLVGVLTLLPLGRRLFRGAALLLVSFPPLLAVLLVAAGTYRFRYMLWPHRLAALQALAIACLALALPASTPVARRPMVRVAALLALTWAAQLFVLGPRRGIHALGSPPGARSARGPRAPGRPRCPPKSCASFAVFGGQLPRRLPVSSFGDLHPVFHQQSVVFEARQERARHAPRLRVVPASVDAAPPAEGFCHGPRVGGLEVEGGM